MSTPQLGDTVAWSSLLLLDGERRRREGTVVAVADDGWITVEIPQPGSSPMRVSSLPEHFTVVHTFDLAYIREYNARRRAAGPRT